MTEQHTGLNQTQTSAEQQSDTKMQKETIH